MKTALSILALSGLCVVAQADIPWLIQTNADRTRLLTFSNEHAIWWGLDTNKVPLPGVAFTTNIPCIVNINVVTNVTERYPTRAVFDVTATEAEDERTHIPGGYCICTNQVWPDPPVEKDVVTTVERHIVYIFYFSDQTVTVVEPIASSTVHLYLHTTNSWEKTP